MSSIALSNKRQTKDNQDDTMSTILSDHTSSQRFMISVTIRWIFFITSLQLIAFLAGRTARTISIQNRGNSQDLTLVADRFESFSTETLSIRHLPYPAVREGKSVPQTIYTSKILDEAKSFRFDSVLAREPSDDHLQNNSVVTESTKNEHCPVHPPTESIFTDEHLPAGQHVIVDIKNVDSAFLNSKERMIQAMVDVVMLAGLTMLSYHCHSLESSRISCVAVLLESHMSFHSLPNQGVIFIDLFTCGSNSLLPLIPVIKERFGLRMDPTVNSDHVESSFMLWAHKLRGFRSDADATALSNDLGIYYLGVMELEMKEKIASAETEFQMIDIYDFIEPRFSSIQSYHRSLSNDGSYESKHPQLYLPNRILFLDGVMQSQRRGEAEYHEALVHPAMFSHMNPKRVAIIGGGEGATLREVLKHNTVEEIVMVEIDQQMVNLSRTHLPEWSDCSDLIGSELCCFDDRRATIYYEDALKWFITRYSTTEARSESNSPRFDVIIMDALDPEDDIDFSDVLYNNTIFFESLYNALSSDGILVSQTGEAPSLIDPAESLSRNRKRAMASRHIEKQGFQSIHSYEESHAGFLGVWTYLVAFKSFETRKMWFAKDAEVAVRIHKRAMRTWSGNSPFRYFDGSTMMTYQFPSKNAEVVFCRETPTPPGCELGHGFDPKRPFVPVSSLEVTSSSIGNGAGRGVITKSLIPKGAYIALDDAVNKVFFPPSTVSLIDELVSSNHEAFEELETLDYYMHGYGFQGEFFGDVDVTVDGGIITFENHGCNGTYNVGVESMETEMTAVLERMPEDKCNTMFYHGGSMYNPFVDRNIAHYFHEGGTAIRDIFPGEEILDNYMFFTASMNDWEQDIVRLREMCSGQNIGEIAEYEAFTNH